MNSAYYQLELEGYISIHERRGCFVNAVDHLITIPKPIKFESPIQIPSPYSYDFSYSTVDFDSFPFSIWRRLMKESIDKADAELLSMSDPKGDPKLRIAISSYLRNSRGLNASPEDIIVSAGTEHLYYLIQRLLGSGVHFAFEDPGYPWGNQFFTFGTTDPIPIPVNTSGIDIRQLSQSCANVVLVTPAHQFPTGYVMSVSRRIELLNWASEIGERYIIEDDYDGEFKYVGKPVPALKSTDSADRVIYMGSFSKSLTPSLRISYMALPKNLMRRYSDTFSGFGCPCSIFVQRALTKFIDEGYFEKHLNRMRSIYGKKRALLKEALQDRKDVKVSGEEAGLSLLLTIESEMAENCIIETAKSIGVRAYGVNRYRKLSSSRYPQLILGYANLSAAEIVNGIDRFISCLEP